jgi:hypothetical protein
MRVVARQALHGGGVPQLLAPVLHAAGREGAFGERRGVVRELDGRPADILPAVESEQLTV